jgi:hypothetical protein
MAITTSGTPVDVVTIPQARCTIIGAILIPACRPRTLARHVMTGLEALTGAAGQRLGTVKRLDGAREFDESRVA